MLDPIREAPVLGTLLVAALAAAAAGETLSPAIPGSTARSSVSPSAAQAALSADGARMVGAVMAEVERLITASGDAHSAEVRDMDGRIRQFGAAVHRMGPGAIEPLGRYLNDPTRPLRARLYAAAFLGFQDDPRAFRPLKACLIDPANDPSLRAVALNSIGSLRLSRGALRKILEYIIEPAPGSVEYPEPVAREAMSQLAILGAEDATVAARAARRWGNDPESTDGANAYYMVRALAASKDPRAAKALLDLLGFYRHGSRIELSVLRAMENRWKELGSLDKTRLRFLTDALDKRWGPNPTLAAQILGELRDPASVPALLSVLQAPDPAVVAEVAGALALIGDPAASVPLRRLSDSIRFDPRFVQKEGGPDTSPLIARIRHAADAFPAAPGPREEGRREEETAPSGPDENRVSPSTGAWNPWQIEEWDSGVLFSR